jgi:hypothetical protein
VDVNFFTSIGMLRVCSSLSSSRLVLFGSGGRSAGLVERVNAVCVHMVGVLWWFRHIVGMSGGGLVEFVLG